MEDEFKLIKTVSVPGINFAAGNALCGCTFSGLHGKINIINPKSGYRLRQGFKQI